MSAGHVPLSGNQVILYLFLEFLVTLEKTSWLRVIEPWGVKELDRMSEIIRVLNLQSGRLRPQVQEGDRPSQAQSSYI